MDSTLQKLQEKNIHYGLADENRCLRSRLWERIMDRILKNNFSIETKKNGIVFIFLNRGNYYSLLIDFSNKHPWDSEVTLYADNGSILFTDQLSYRGNANHPLLIRLWENIIEQLFNAGFKRSKKGVITRFNFTIRDRNYSVIVKPGSWGDITGDYYGNEFIFCDSDGNELLSEFVFLPGESHDSNASHPLDEIRELSSCSSHRLMEIRKTLKSLAQFA